MGLLKDAIIQAGGIRDAIPALERQSISPAHLEILREVDEAMRALKLEWARRRTHTAKLPLASIAAIDQGLAAGLSHRQIAINANTTNTTVWRYAQKRRGALLRVDT